MQSGFEHSPLSPLLALGLLAWLHVMLRRADPEGELTGARWTLVGVLLLWLIVSLTIGYRGYYLALNADTLLILLGTAVPLAAVGLLALSSRRVRALLVRFTDRTPFGTLAFVHVLRIAAIGTIYKGYVGALPAHFILPVGVPDFLIGLTAYPLARRVFRNGLESRKIFVGWNALGAAILLIAPILIQLSQPGPFQMFIEGPTTDEVLSFPMVIVPTFVAPLLVGLHLIALAKVRRVA